MKAERLSWQHNYHNFFLKYSMLCWVTTQYISLLLTCMSGHDPHFVFTSRYHEISEKKVDIDIRCFIVTKCSETCQDFVLSLVSTATFCGHLTSYTPSNRKIATFCQKTLAVLFLVLYGLIPCTGSAVTENRIRQKNTQKTVQFIYKDSFFFIFWQLHGDISGQSTMR